MKKCMTCDTTFEPYRAKKYCSTCSVKAKEAALERKRVKAYNRWANKQRELGREEVIGVGRGGNQPKGVDSPHYKTGIGLFHSKLKYEVKEEQVFCQHCKTDLRNATQYHWCVHHKDHNRGNNCKTNLELLCKRCHQIEHECWKAFEGATTISKESTPKQVEAHGIPRDDDIV